MYLFMGNLLILKETDISQFLPQSLTSSKPTNPAPLKWARSLPLLLQPVTIGLSTTETPRSSEVSQLFLQRAI